MGEVGRHSRPDFVSPRHTRIVALLSYFDESPTWLRDLIETLPVCGVSHLVALDGRYELYQHPLTRSPAHCRQAIEQACRDNDLGLTHADRDTPWRDEIEKRTALFELAESVTTEHDWYFVVDADERITQAPGKLPKLLATTDALVGEAVLWDDQSDIPLRMFFKAVRGLKVVDNHYTYQTPDGRRLWGDWNTNLEPAIPTGVKVEHRDKQRPAQRRDRKFAFYDLRDQQSPEQHECAWCKQPATGSIPWNWRWSGPGIVGDRTGVCPDCEPGKLEESIAAAAELGVDASHLRSSDRQFR